MKNPTTLVINAGDYNDLEADGVTPHVASLVVRSTSLVPPRDAVDVNIGKPAQDPDGAIRYPLAGTELLDTINAMGGAGTFDVSELGPGGRGTPSNAIAIERETAEGTPSIGFE